MKTIIACWNDATHRFHKEHVSRRWVDHCQLNLGIWHYPEINEVWVWRLICDISKEKVGSAYRWAVEKYRLDDPSDRAALVAMKLAGVDE